MLLRAARDSNIDLAQSYMVGDKVSDCEAGEHAGCTAVLISNESPPGMEFAPWTVIRNISELLQLT